MRSTLLTPGTLAEKLNGFAKLLVRESQQRLHLHPGSTPSDPLALDFASRCGWWYISVCRSHPEDLKALARFDELAERVEQAVLTRCASSRLDWP